MAFIGKSAFPSIAGGATCILSDFTRYVTANAIGQLYLMDEIIGDGYSAYGYNVLMKAIRREKWDQSSFFPRVTNCYFKVRRMGENIHPYVVQCVLPINLFNEKIYLFLWWWNCLVAALSFVGLIIYFPIFFSCTNRR